MHVYMTNRSYLSRCFREISFFARVIQKKTASLTEPSGFDNSIDRSLPNVFATLWLFNIAMGNGPFIDGLPFKNGDFPWLC